MIGDFFESHEKNQRQDRKSGANEAGLNRDTYNPGEQGRGALEARLRLVQVIKHACRDDNVTQCRPAEPNLQR